MLQSCKVARLQCYKVVRLQGCKVVRLQVGRILNMLASILKPKVARLHRLPAAKNLGVML